MSPARVHEHEEALPAVSGDPRGCIVEHACPRHILERVVSNEVVPTSPKTKHDPRRRVCSEHCRGDTALPASLLHGRQFVAEATLSIVELECSGRESCEYRCDHCAGE